MSNSPAPTTFTTKLTAAERHLVGMVKSDPLHVTAHDFRSLGGQRSHRRASSGYRTFA